MNRNTIVNIGGETYTIAILLSNVRTARSAEHASYWATMVYLVMAECNDFDQDILFELNTALEKKGVPNPFVGASKNLSSSLQPPPRLVNHIFIETLDMTKMWKWITNHFIDHHTQGYDWFALLRFFADKRALADGIAIKNSKFAEQMNEWYPSLGCKADDIRLYREGYLGETRYTIWVINDFLINAKPKQKEEGFNHLNTLCNTHLSMAYEEDKFY